MSTDVEDGVDIPPTPFPPVLVFAWLSLLEGTIAAGLTVFSIALLEGGEIIPDILAEWSVGVGAFVVATALTLGYRLYKGGYIGA